MNWLLPALVLSSCDPGSDPAPNGVVERPFDPGRVTVHRLNKAEYDATVRDLLGTTLTPARDFPDDDFANGWDNMAAALTLSPLHLEEYERAAWAVVDDALGPMAPEPTQEIQQAELIGSYLGFPFSDWGLVFWWNDYVGAAFPVAWEGDYVVQVRAAGYSGFPDPPQMRVDVDGVEVALHGVRAPVAAPGVYEATVHLAPGPHAVTAAYVNDLHAAGTGQSRHLVVDWIGLDGPYAPVISVPPTRARVLACDLPATDERACARANLVEFLPRAWRRPVQAAEIDALMGVYDVARDNDLSWEEGIRGVLVTALVSPNFVFRIERDRDPTSTVPRPLDGYELASRLSYFLWSSMPDDELFELAETGELLDDETLGLQVTRMLGDPRAMALVDNFAGQWLLIRAIDEVSPDPVAFPDFDAALRASMKQEMRLYAQDVLLTDRSMRDLLTADEAWVDARLARHYGIADLGDPAPVRVDTTGYPRTGFLTTAGLLTALSNPTRTSAVKRGQWVLSSLLCETPPPPPPGVEGLPVDDGADDLSIREQMEAHRSDPTCATCHQSMDAFGFSFEHYDGIGAYREEYEDGHPIDASGRLPDGTSFDDVTQLTLPLAYSPKFSRCVVEKTFTYALGRAPTVEDVPALEAIEAGFVADDLHFDDLVRAIVLSKAFRWRRGEPEVTP